ncbi:MAG: hypothetical protein HC782_03370 [Gammaproteobacteria bacterium]|nr:hypothetical protein [Gammaproteobacteria bacterium]
MTSTDMVTNATGAIARFLGSLAALLLLAGYSLGRRRALPASLKTHTHTRSTAVSRLKM